MAVSELLSELVRIDSINPDMVGRAGEREVARFVAGWLETPASRSRSRSSRRAGSTRSSRALRRRQVAPPQRAHGHGRRGRHGAAVRACRRERALHGRGSYDMKAGLAAIMLAGADAAGAGLRGDVIVTAVADEEVASIGSGADRRALRRRRSHRLGPTEMRLALAHKGFVGFEIETKGRAAHGSRPDLGIDAIAHMGHVLVGIEELDRRLRADPTHLLGSGSLHARHRGRPGVLELSGALPAQGRAAHHPGRVDRARRGAAGAPRRHRRRDPRRVARQPFETPADEAIAELVSRHAGGPDRRRPVLGRLRAPLLSRHPHNRLRPCGRGRPRRRGMGGPRQRRALRRDLLGGRARALPESVSRTATPWGQTPS